MSRRVASLVTSAIRSVATLAGREEMLSTAKKIEPYDISTFGKNIREVGRFFAYDNSSPNTISLGASNPIYPPPPHYAAEALAKSMLDAEISYYRSRSVKGIPGLSDALKEHYKREGFSVKDCSTLFTNSIHTGLRLLLDNFLQKGDTVGLPIPTFGLFFEAIHRREIGVNPIRLTAETDWKLTPDILRETLRASPRMQLFVFINPNNPIGKIYSKEETEALAKVFIAHNFERSSHGEKPLIVFNDESSKTILLGNTPFPSIGAVKGMEDFTLTISSFSKDLAPGLALSYAIGPQSLIETITDTKHDPLIGDSGPSFPLQYLAKQTFTADREKWEEHCAKSNEFYVRNLAMVQELTDGLDSTITRTLGSGPRKYAKILTTPEAGLQCVVQTEGLRGLAFPESYDWPSRTINSSLDLAWYLKQTAGVTLQPGENMGFDGEEMMFRVTISKDPRRIIEAFHRMETVLSTLKTPTLAESRRPSDSVTSPTMKELADSLKDRSGGLTS